MSATTKTAAVQAAYDRVREEFEHVAKAGHMACIPSSMLNVDALVHALEAPAAASGAGPQITDDMVEAAAHEFLRFAGADQRVTDMQMREALKAALAAAPAAAQAMQAAGWLIVSTGAGGQLCAQHCETERGAREALPHHSGGRAVPCYVPADGAPAAAQPMDGLLTDAAALLASFVEDGKPLAREEARDVLKRLRSARIAPQAPAAAQGQPIPLSTLEAWLERRYRAAGGIAGITNVTAWAEEVMRWTEEQHRIGGAAGATGEQQAGEQQP